MLDRVLLFAVRQRIFVVLLAVALAGVGIWSFGKLPIDAVPDITNVQVQINTQVQALSPVEVEKLVTFPIEWAMGGIPGVEQVRSLSRYGLSQVTVVFEDGTDIYRARQLVAERLLEAKESLPAGIGEPTMGPISTGLGEIYMWEVHATGPRPDGSPYSLTDLRTVQDWIVRPQLRTVPGVTEVNSIGGYERQIHVTPDPAKLRAYGLSFRDVADALAANNANVGGGYVEHRGEQYVIRSTGRVESLEDVLNVKLGVHDGVPVLVRHVAGAAEGKELRTGAATVSGEEAVVGTAIMLLGENSRTVSRRVDEKIRAIAKSLPENVEVKTLYDRTYLVEATLQTVRNNLLEGAVLVIVILFLLLGHVRAALIVALAIPLSMLFAVAGMVRGGISGNLMSLGAVDFGIIVDGAVVMVEHILRRLGEAGHNLGRAPTRAERVSLAYEASREVARPVLFGVGIIMIVYIPILSLTGIEGKMFRPMAEVVLLALAGSLLLTFTLVPALIALLLGGKVSEKDNALVRAAKASYAPTLDVALRRPGLVVGSALLLLAGTGLLASGLGSTFVPKLGEGAIAVQPARMPSISLGQSVAMQGQVEKRLLAEFPDEVLSVFARTGTAEVATDPMGPNVSDTYVMLKPREGWKKARTQEELADRMAEALEAVPGQAYEFSQPIELRFNELISGVRSDLAVKVFGDDLETLRGYAGKVARILGGIPGAADVKVEQVTGLPVLTVEVDRAAIARYGLNVAEVQEVVEIALGGREAGEWIEGDRRTPLVVRLPERIRNDLDSLRNLPVPVLLGGSDEEPPGDGETSSGGPSFLPLSTFARIELVEGPNQISREAGKRRVVVQCNVRGRDLGSFVEEAQVRIDREIPKLPEGYWLGWGGQFENLIAAKERLEVVVPLALFLILLLLFATFGSIKQALLVFTGVPLALTGGVVALWARDLPFSISAGIGFIALSGVAVLNGLVMVSFINRLREEGRPLADAVREGSLARLRPVLMTALVASLGFVPMALATGTGAEVQRPLATVVIGGLVSSTLLTLVALPVLYRLFHRGDESGNGMPSAPVPEPSPAATPAA
ncbi:MAG: CusA/CzcA family heavy metal efflux RND transporter [Planctomycetaceae bacterium]|nr:CusA/CzcA family heavy metal efflux RND transporter [Planctomycetota bacterium]NUN51195.1 CusA/CzcA family heavy metal efflux RND transporter [Planctomycetaceae bacterium]